MMLITSKRISQHVVVSVVDEKREIDLWLTLPEASQLGAALSELAELDGDVLDEVPDDFRPETPRLCPECTQGKPINCAGLAQDNVTDELVPCEGGQ